MMADNTKFLVRLKEDMWDAEEYFGRNFLTNFFFDLGEIEGDLPEWRKKKYLGWSYSMAYRSFDEDDEEDYLVMKFSKNDADDIYVRFDIDSTLWDGYQYDTAIDTASLVVPVETETSDVRFEEVL